MAPSKCPVFVVALRSGGLLSLMQNAGSLAHVEVVASSLDVAARRGRLQRAGATILVHDFLPDAAVSVALLDSLSPIAPLPPVFVLLERPMTSAVDCLLGTPHRFTVCGAAVADEQSSSTLAEHLRRCVERVEGRSLLEVVVRQWGLNPVLATLAEEKLATGRPHATLEGLLRACRIGRKRFVKHARESGFDTPLRFLHGLQVLEAVSLLQEGLTMERAAARVGCGSADTLRHHFHEVLGMTPAAARNEPLLRLASVAREAVGSPAAA
jgi:AraC-like DNA-binding protein